jgi:hypothetical protein
MPIVEAFRRCLSELADIFRGFGRRHLVVVGGSELVARGDEHKRAPEMVAVKSKEW